MGAGGAAPANAQALTRPPVLGIQATLSAPLPNPVPKNTRALIYVWFLRKWIKKSRAVQLGLPGAGGGTLAGLGSHFGLSLGGQQGAGGAANWGGIMGQVEVRVEWKRRLKKAVRGEDQQQDQKRGRKQMSLLSAAEAGNGQAKRVSLISQKDGEANAHANANGKSNGNGNGHGNGNISPVGSRSRSPKHRPTGAIVPPGPMNKKERRKSWLSKATSSTTDLFADGANSEGGSGASAEGSSERDKDKDKEDDGDESDPEDSETPWVCTLKMKRVGNWGVPQGHQQQGLSPTTTTSGESIGSCLFLLLPFAFVVLSFFLPWIFAFVGGLGLVFVFLSVVFRLSACWIGEEARKEEAVPRFRDR